jgi:hypothetical protein
MRNRLSMCWKYQQTGSDLAIKDKTLDIATWNMVFGGWNHSPAAGKPNSDAIQAAVKNVLQQLDADVYTVEEVSDDILFAQMVSEMNDYSFCFIRSYFSNEIFGPNKSRIYL